MKTDEREKVLQSIPKTGFFGHPKGLFTLFFTEFWERFSYYGMRAILLYYLYYEVSKGGLGLDYTTSLSIYAIYGSLVYLSGIIGGWIADRLLGASMTVFYGGVFIMVGHIVLALPFGVTAFFVSMFFIIIGTGLLKPNVSNIVGDIYAPTDNRRDSGFSIFYMGINLGAFTAPIIVSRLWSNYSFHAGFAAAAVGMFIGLVVFMITKKKNLGLAGMHVPNPLMPEERKKIFSIIGISVAVLGLVGFYLTNIGWMTIDRFILIVTIIAIIMPVIYFVVMYRSPKTNADERSRLLAYIPLFLASVMFWAIQEQGASLLGLYADTRTDLSFWGMEISPALFQSLNPIFIITIAPIAAWLWVKLGDRQPSTSKKFALALFFAGLSFLVMIFPAYINGTESLVSPLWLVLSFFLVVLGELCLSPVGLSATTKLAPAAFSAQTMSLWFLSSASAQAINAQIVKFYDTETEVIYFGAIGGFAILLGLAIFMMSPVIQRYMRGVR
ncbi:MAG: peptide MFS transporter [Bacillus sp. (in: firmicutes)]